MFFVLKHLINLLDAGIFLRQKEEDKKALKTTSTPETVPETAPAPLRKEDTQSSISYKGKSYYRFLIIAN